MPKLIVQTNLSAGDRADVTLSERIVGGNLASPHYTAQLIERVAWAIADAEEIESRANTNPADRVRTTRPSGRRRRATEERRAENAARRARLAASALVVLITAVLSLAPAALADSWRATHGLRGQLAHGVAAGVALDWYDITDQTVAAAAYPERVTQSRAWSVSWLAAAAVGDHRDSSYTVAAFAQALHDTLEAQVPGQGIQLDADIANTLARIPDGPDKSAGIAAGAQ